MPTENLVHGIDKNGKYLGLVSPEQAFQVVPKPSAPTWVWNFKTALWSPK